MIILRIFHKDSHQERANRHYGFRGFQNTFGGLLRYLVIGVFNPTVFTTGESRVEYPEIVRFFFYVDYCTIKNAASGSFIDSGCHYEEHPPNDI